MIYSSGLSIYRSHNSKGKMGLLLVQLKLCLHYTILQCYNEFIMPTPSFRKLQPIISPKPNKGKCWQKLSSLCIGLAFLSYHTLIINCEQLEILQKLLINITSSLEASLANLDTKLHVIPASRVKIESQGANIL